MARIGLRLLSVVIAIAAAGLAIAYVATTETWRLAPPSREGPVALVMQGTKPHLWVLVKQSEHRSFGGSRLGTRYHFEIHCHDAETTAVVWRRRLLTLSEAEQGYNARARILGPDGDVVWLFLKDQPIAVAVADGTPLVGRERLEAQAPALKGLLPTELQYYAHDAGLVVTTADARRMRIRAPEFTAAPYVAQSDDAFRRISFMATQWNGGYQTKDFQVRQAMFGSRWIGLHTPAEAADAGDDGWGSNLKDPSRVKDEGTIARRALWTATIGRTRVFSEGAHDRLTEVRRLPEATAEYLQGGFLIKAGTRTPLALENPPGAAIIHRTRIDATGMVALTRLDARFSPLWTATLPFSELTNRWELSGRLLLYGSLESPESGIARNQDLIVAIDLRDGRVQIWNVTLQSAGGR